jgi:hypothetical protein
LAIDEETTELAQALFVWRAKERISKSSGNDMRTLAAYIKKEAAKARKATQKSVEKRTA